MPEHPTRARSAGAAGQAADTTTHLDQALWRRMAEARTEAEFCLNWLGLQASMIGGVWAGVVVLRRQETDSFAPAAFWPRGLRDRKSFTGVVERALAERKGVVIRSETDTGGRGDDARVHLAYPVRIGEELHGVVAFQLEPRDRLGLQSAMRQLQWGVAWVQNWILTGTAEPHASVRRRLTETLELTALALDEGRFKAAATAFVTELATRLSCDRVSIGFTSGNHVKVHALSHSAQFGKQMNLIRSIGMAMSESVDQRSLIVYPDPGKGDQQVVQAHEQLVRIHGGRHVLTVPFVDHGGNAFGAMTLERSGEEPFDDDTIEICDGVAALVGPILEEKRKNDRYLISKIGHTLWEQVKKLVGPRHTVRKLVAAGAIGLAAFFTFATGTYRVTAKTTLEGGVQRAVVAPFQGFIFEAPVRAGDIVRQGEVMCRLDDRDLRLEHAKWTSERERYRLEHRRAMAEGEIAAMEVLTKKIRQSDAQLALLEEQLSRATLVAPFDGVVVSGDLSQSLGAPVETGELLFEVAPLDSYRLMLQVDEHDIDQIEVGQRGELILTAFPDIKQSFEIVRITPVSVSEEGRNFFMVEAKLDEISERLRPGMEGFGKIAIDRRRLIWIWTHDLIDWARLLAWSWWP